MKNYILVLLASLFSLALFLGLEPLLSYPIWGSDTGEYYYLTAYLVTHGQLLLSNYPGWGTSYPDFPGIFILGGAVSEATGVSPLFSLEVVVPFVGALATFPLFLLFRRFFERDGIALLGAAIAAVVFPRIFVLAHPVPDTLGDLLAVGALWMFVEQRRDVRWFVPLALGSLALIVSHHLSSYFFLISAVGIVTGLELFSPRRWSRRFPAREYAFITAFTMAMFAYWTLYATSFGFIIQEGVPFLHIGPTWLPVVLMGFTVGGVVILSLLVYIRRRFLAPHRSPFHPRWPTPRKLYRDGIILTVLIFGGASLLVLVPIPGTGQTVPAVDVLWFTPLLALVPLSAGGISNSAGARLGPAPYAWVVALIVSATLAAATNSAVLPVERHAEYVEIALAIVVAVGLGSMIGRLDRNSLKFGAGVAVAVVLVAANSVLAFPPPQLSDGFQEGFTSQDVALVQWGAHALPGGSALASDHRLSDLYFGYSGNPATWSTTCHLFLGNVSECPHYPGNATQAALSELRASQAPHGQPRPIDVVAIDATMISIGVALDPSQLALPLNQTMLQFIEGPDFVLLYQNGEQQMWLFTGS